MPDISYHEKSTEQTIFIFPSFKFSQKLFFFFFFNFKISRYQLCLLQMHIQAGLKNSRVDNSQCSTCSSLLTYYQRFKLIIQTRLTEVVELTSLIYIEMITHFIHYVDFSLTSKPKHMFDLKITSKTNCRCLTHSCPLEAVKINFNLISREYCIRIACYKIGFLNFKYCKWI